MANAADCSHNTDPLRLVREGTSQDQRQPAALDPTSAPVDGRTWAHDAVFAQDYAKLLKYFNANNLEQGDWTSFFSGDVSAQLAVAAIEDVDVYKSNTKSWFDYLNQRENLPNTDQLKNSLGYLYASVGTLAAQLDALKEKLPPDASLKATLENLIQTRLAEPFARLIGYYKGGKARNLVSDAVPAPEVLVLRKPLVPFDSTTANGLSRVWSNGNAWAGFVAAINEDASVYGDALSGSPLPDAEKIFTQINHAANHALFKSVFSQFLKVFARVVSEANQALEKTLTSLDTHEPHYALFLAFLQLFGYARNDANTLTARHLDFYYRRILRLREKPAEPGHVHLLAELAKQASSRDFKSGELFKAGKDSLGRDVVFANDRDFVANRAKVAALKNVYREGVEKKVADAALLRREGRIFASPVANSEDGLGATLTSADQSWHPFYNKTYGDGALQKIDMPEADVGFAIASHHLFLAEGGRWIIAVIEVDGYAGPVSGASGGYVDYSPDVCCLLTTEKSWLEKEACFFGPNGSATEFLLAIFVSGEDAPITPYAAKVHGHTFDTDLPLLLVKLKQDDTRKFAYPALEGITVNRISLYTDVQNLKSLAASNDYGPVDTSKPFQPFGPSPVANNALIIGSRELFQKNVIFAQASLDWLVAPVTYETTPKVVVSLLSGATWAIQETRYDIASTTAFSFPASAGAIDQPDFGASAYYSTASRHGFVRLSLDDGFGIDTYQKDLIAALITNTPVDTLDPAPVAPSAGSLSLDYSASQTIELSSASGYEDRVARFFHVGPFGDAERHPFLKSAANSPGPIHLLPQLAPPKDAASDAAEFYIGIADLQPPQNLSLLIEVADGTANPLALKPKPHVGWSWLHKNEWADFSPDQVQDATGELLNSGIITFAVPREASDDNSILPSGMFWIRAAVHQMSDAVCQFRLVAAQALRATFSDRGNAPDFSAKVLEAGTISKLDQPDAAVKTISQPYASFGGRGAEAPSAFYTRVSERLRHKDRSVALWDYERIILDAFPQIFKVKCLNHTCFEPSESGDGIYRELAPGHVTIVTIPDLKFHNLRDPLRPNTSLGLLQEIETFVAGRSSCFARLHVKNPQFEALRTRFKVRLGESFDQGYCVPLLQQAITRFLSPWAFADSGSPTFGGKIYKSVLINFVEDQPYVDYVTDFQLFVDINDVAGSTDYDEVAGSRAVSILVSAPAARHDISVINPAVEQAPGEDCGCQT